MGPPPWPGRDWKNRPIDVHAVTDPAEADAAVDLAERVWGTRPLSDPILRALELAGLYLSVARDGDAIVGMCAGMVGVHDEPAGPELHVHSHLAAVDPSHRGRGIGRALKRHQREWCLARGITHVSWTFDPLVVVNARFNLHHLGARGDRYLVDLYGPMDDEINRGDPSDRLLVWWDLESPTATAALDATLPTPAGAALRAAGATDVVVAGPDGPIVRDAAGDRRLVATPADVVGLRRRDADRARAWRQTVRDAMLDAFAAGLAPTAITDDGCYLFEPTVTDRERT